MLVPYLIFGMMLCSPLHDQHPAGAGLTVRGEPLRIMWYNVENLFHPEDDSIAGDDEFTPWGPRHWTIERYRKKLTGLAKVIVAAGYGEPPEVVGMCEVENRTVLEDLVSHPVLAPYRYQVIHADSPDLRGTDVACIFRGDRIGQTGWRVINSTASGRGTSTRQLLLVEIAWDTDTIHLMLLHFISKFSGEGATAESRRDQALQLTQLLDSLTRSHPGRLMVVGGDFNDPGDGYSLEPLQTARFGADSLVRIPLSGAGSYKYMGVWSSIDHFYLSGSLARYRIKGTIFELPALLVPDATHGGMKPFRTYQGPVYKGGISDHLPILLEINHSLFSKDYRW